VPVIAELALNETAIHSSCAETHITWVSREPVSDGDRIVVFTAKPTGEGEMIVHPQSGLQLALSRDDTQVELDRSLDEMLAALDHYVERVVSDRWFKYRQLPRARQAAA